MALLLDLRGALDDAGHRPSLAPAQRPRLRDRHFVPHLGIVGLVVREELRRPLLSLAVHRVLDTAFDGDNDALLHAVADDHPLQFGFRAHGYFAFSLRTVFTLASSRRTLRIFPGASSCPIAFWMRMRNS